MHLFEPELSVDDGGGGGDDGDGDNPPPPPPADVDCAESGNTAADCLDSCAVAAATVTTEQSGSGAACVGDYTCVAGDGACPADEPPPPPPPSGGDNCVGDVCVTADQITAEGPGTTWQITLTLSGSATNVYTVFGTEASPMSIPASYQENAPFGSNTGGVSPQFTAIIATAAYDGWLTVGITEGDGAGALGNIGIDWDGWTADAGIENNNCAVFWLSPDDSPAGSAVVAQFTVAGDWSASFGAQGRSSEGGGNDWTADNLVLSS